jgi:hypothetical protein
MMKKPIVSVSLDKRDLMHVQLTAATEMKKMTIGSFQTREKEMGRESLTTTITQWQDKFGRVHLDKIVTRVKITADDIQTLREAFAAAVCFSEEPHGWLAWLAYVAGPIVLRQDVSCGGDWQLSHYARRSGAFG